jgi:hypothetical protein
MASECEMAPQRNSMIMRRAANGGLSKISGPPRYRGWSKDLALTLRLKSLSQTVQKYVT